MVQENKLFINGKECFFDTGETILQVARKNNIDIPTLCYLKGTTPTGACRMCVVDVKGSDKLVTACNTTVGSNMEIETDSPAVIKARKDVIELMLTTGEHDCMLCPQNGECELQDLAFTYKVEGKTLPNTCKNLGVEDVNPLIVRDFDKCVLCGRCTQACNDVQVNNAITFDYAASKGKIVAGDDVSLTESDCVFCGECVQVCPTGALYEKKFANKARMWETKKVRSTCPYCGVGCQVWLHMKGEKIVRVTGVEDAAPNKGRLCVKGRFAYDFIHSEKRLTTPLIKRNGTFEKASWDEALDLVAEKFKTVLEESGPDAIAGVACSRSINEDAYQMQKLFRGVFKSNNIDNCART